jgi:signal transduction histidine kinase
MDLDAEQKREILDVTNMLWELADEFQPQAAAKRQLLVLGPTNNDSKVKGDALKIRQALRNLIGNAIKYTPYGGTVTLSLEHKSNMACIHIKDTGYGIPHTDLPHIFDRFYRVPNNGHADIEGNGLGLAIVKTTAEGHGGNVTVKSELGKGSFFTFSLPFAQSEIVTVENILDVEK